MQKIIDCLWFNGQAEKAAAFYTSIFKNSRILQVTRNTGPSPHPEFKVLTVNFTLGGREFMALNGGPEYKFNPAISLVVKCRTQKEIDTYWRKLSRGGKVVECGWLEDKFGVSWQIIPSELNRLLSGRDPARSQRVMQALLKMKKLDIDKLKRAHSGK